MSKSLENRFPALCSHIVKAVGTLLPYGPWAAVPSSRMLFPQQSLGLFPHLMFVQIVIFLVWPSLNNIFKIIIPLPLQIIIFFLVALLFFVGFILRTVSIIELGMFCFVLLFFTTYLLLHYNTSCQNAKPFISFVRYYIPSA